MKKLLAILFAAVMLVSMLSVVTNAAEMDMSKIADWSSGTWNADTKTITYSGAWQQAAFQSVGWPVPTGMETIYIAFESLPMDCEVFYQDNEWKNSESKWVVAGTESVTIPVADPSKGVVYVIIKASTAGDIVLKEIAFDKEPEPSTDTPAGTDTPATGNKQIDLTKANSGSTATYDAATQTISFPASYTFADFSAGWPCPTGVTSVEIKLGERAFDMKFAYQYGDGDWGMVETGLISAAESTVKLTVDEPERAFANIRIQAGEGSGDVVIESVKLYYGDEPVEEPVEEPVVTDAPVTEAPVTDAPETDAPETEAPVTEAPEVDEPKVEDPKPAEEATPVGVIVAAIVAVVVIAAVVVFLVLKKKK